MTATCPLNSVGQSASLVMRKSAVRIRKGAQIIQPTEVGFFMPKNEDKGNKDFWGFSGVSVALAFREIMKLVKPPCKR